MTNFTPEQLAELDLDFAAIKEKDFNITEEDITPLMKQMVHEEYGEEDLATSGYWVRAQAILNKYHSR